MKNQILLIIVLASCFNYYSQNSFEKENFKNDSILNENRETSSFNAIDAKIKFPKNKQHNTNTFLDKKFNLTIRPRLRNSSLLLTNVGANPSSVDFGSDNRFAFGIEAEFFTNQSNSWSFIIEPIYQSFESETSQDVTNIVGGKHIADISYKSIELPIGFRHYFIKKENSSMFTNISFILDFDLKSIVNFSRADGSNIQSFNIDTTTNLVFGLGYKISKASIEFRYQTKRDLFGNIPWQAKYSNISFILGYSLF